MKIGHRAVVATGDGNRRVDTIYKWLAEGKLFRVKTYNEETGQFELTQIKSITNEYLPTRVIKAFSHKHTCCTDDTMLLVKDKGWKRADEIEVGDWVMNNNGRYLSVLSILNDQKVRPVFDIKVHQGTNLVLTSGVVKC